MVRKTLDKSELPYAKVDIIKLFTEIPVSLFLRVSIHNILDFAAILRRVYQKAWHTVT